MLPPEGEANSPPDVDQELVRRNGGGEQGKLDVSIQYGLVQQGPVAHYMANLLIGWGVDWSPRGEAEERGWVAERLSPCSLQQRLST